MSWGINWGINWGYGSDDSVSNDFYIVSARANSSRSFRITFSKEPVFQSTLSPNDAANLRNWKLVRSDTNQSVVMLTGRLTDDPNTLEFYILGRWRDQFTSYVITAENLVAIDATPLTVPRFANFSGLPAAIFAAPERRPLLDVFNPQVMQEQVNGALVVGSGGDYLNESGVILLKKLIIRRITVARDSFRHLVGQNYGAGIQPNLLYTPSDLVLLKASLENEIKLEPEVASATVSLRLFSDNRLECAVQARVKTSNQQISFSLPLNNPGILVQ